MTRLPPSDDKKSVFLWSLCTLIWLASLSNPVPLNSQWNAICVQCGVWGLDLRFLHVVVVIKVYKSCFCHGLKLCLNLKLPMMFTYALIYAHIYRSCLFYWQISSHFLVHMKLQATNKHRIFFKQSIKVGKSRQIIKIIKIRDCFPSTDNTNPILPSSKPAQFSAFSEVPLDTVRKILLNSPTKSCLLDPWPTFLIKDCADILLPSLTKLINLSLLEGCVPDGFKSAVVTPLIKNPHYLLMISKTTVQCPVLVSCLN